jgi:hypothetical protein
VKFRYEVKTRTFACPVWTDDGVNAVPFHLKVDIVHSHEAQKFFAKMPGF